MFAKLGSVLSQWVLGLVLYPEDFAILAAVLSFQVFISSLKDGGVGKYLVQTQNYERNAYHASAFALVLNIFALLVAIAIMPLYQKSTGFNELVWLLLPILLLMPIQSAISIYQAKLRIELRFKEIAWVETISQGLQYAIIVILAFAGFGVVSTVLGICFAALFQIIAYKIKTGALISSEQFTLAIFKFYFKKCLWIIIAAIGMGLALRGNIMVLNFHPDKSGVGTYFFGYQTAVAATIIFTASFQVVVVPIMRKLIELPTEIVNLIRDYEYKILKICVPLCVLSSVLAPYLFHHAWGGRWDDAVIVFQAVMLTAPVKLLASIYGLYLEAKGMWARRAAWIFVDGFMLTCSASLYYLDNSLQYVAISLLIYRVIFSVVYVRHIAKSQFDSKGLNMSSHMILYSILSTVIFIIATWP